MDSNDIVIEIEDLIRTMPDRFYSWGTPDAIDWMGRARSILTLPAVGFHIEAAIAVDQALENSSSMSTKGKNKLLLLLQQARHRLRLEVVGPMSVAVNKGMVFDYFDHLRRVVEEAKTELLFVDPYLDADFVSKYLPFVASGVKVRLLAREKLKTLIPSVQAFAAQSSIQSEVRNGSGFHDRFVFVDGIRGLQSGASFKDGGIKTPTVLLELSDTLQQVLKTYNELWDASPIVYQG
jgi:hypothetical protein